jgi:hypothetical protein
VNNLRQTLWLAPHPFCKCMTLIPFSRGLARIFFRVDIRKALVYFFCTDPSIQDYDETLCSSPKNHRCISKQHNGE